MSAEFSSPRERETWGTRAAFVLAAIGSAVGLGNLWGFPYKLYTYGGGAFLIPYFIAMIVMGIPLLIMEFSIGHWAQQSPPGAFSKVLGRYRFVGWWLVTLAFVIITYYAVILGYCVDYLVVSLLSLGKPSLPWAAETPAVAQSYFLDSMVRFDGSMALGPPAWKIVAGSLTAWLLIYLCLFRGVRWVGKVVLLTVPLPWIMLVILTVRGLTLEGAMQGLEFYLEPRWGKLLEPDTWRFAFGQVFFSMSLGFAVMLSYASFLHRKSDLNNNALIIGLGDIGTSFVAGIAVFSMLGGMAAASGAAVPDLVPEGTVGLSFIVFPYGLTQLPWGAFFSSVFFVALLTLGIDSAFSIVEACLASVCDSRPKWARSVVLPAICILGAGIGLLFTASRGGLNWLDLTDGLINGPFGILIVALAECLVIGWAWRGDFLTVLREHANERSDWKLYRWWDAVVRYVAPAFLSILIVWSVSGMVHKELRTYRASLTPESRAFQALLSRYGPIEEGAQDLRKQLAAAAQRAERLRQAGREEAARIADAEAEALIDQIGRFEERLAPFRDGVDTLRAEAVANGRPAPTPVYRPPWPLILGSLLFVLVPVASWLLSRSGRREPADPARAGVARGVIFALVVMAIAAVVIELAQWREWFQPVDTAFQPNGQLDITAYIFLGIGLVTIFGGLIWCFWKAMQAAGAADTDIPETAPGGD